MNGLKRASRRQAAVFGLAVLMGASFLGCHSGPKLFSRKDREDRAAKKELADKSKGSSKFIDRKKVRPESEYLDDDDEQIAKSSRTSKSGKSAEVAQKSATDDAGRSVATRLRTEESAASTTRSAKPSTNQSKSVPSSSGSRIAAQDQAKARRSIDDLFNDDALFDDIREEHSGANKTVSTNTTSRQTVTKSKSLDEDPFRNSVIGPRSNKPDQTKVATVNFFEDDETDDELDEESEEFDELSLPAAKQTVVKKDNTGNLSVRKATASTSQGQHKYLDELDEPAEGRFRSMIREENSEISIDKIVDRTATKTTEQFADEATSVAGNKPIDRRQQVQQTLDDWRREMDHEVSLPKLNHTTDASERPTASRTVTAPLARGHISQVSIDEFTPPEKSQGAVLEGELIIDTTAFPSRFQRTSGNAPLPNDSKESGTRSNPNTGVNIDIVPGATHTRPRPAGQISLQSASEEFTTSRLTTADFEQSEAPINLEQLPKLKLNSEPITGLKLTAIDTEPNLAPSPPEEMPDLTSESEPKRAASPFRLEKKMLIVFVAMASAVLIGFGLRRRMELNPEPQPVRVPKMPSEQRHDPN